MARPWLPLPGRCANEAARYRHICLLERKCWEPGPKSLWASCNCFSLSSMQPCKRWTGQSPNGAFTQPPFRKEAGHPKTHGALALWTGVLLKKHIPLTSKQLEARDRERDRANTKQHKTRDTQCTKRLPWSVYARFLFVFCFFNLLKSQAYRDLGSVNPGLFTG